MNINVYNIQKKKKEKNSVSKVGKDFLNLTLKSAAKNRKAC